ncbi:MAG: hypothetical protein ACKVOW_06990 [Chitinophagaceae bacterium]
MKHATNIASSEHGAKIAKANCITRHIKSPNGLSVKKDKRAVDTEVDDTSTIKEFSETFTTALKNGNGVARGLERVMTEYELEEQQEKTAMAEEESNYYSIGLDNYGEWDDNRE